MKKLLAYTYFLPIIGLFFYSFTQIDLSLTFSRASVFQTVEKSFQHIGYFQRTTSAENYVILLIALFTYYLYFLRQAYLKKLSLKMIWILIGGTALILAFSYNAFSYDLFNYMFDTKIITHYHQNPYLHKALDYPGDPMLSFMHWTHRTYPYGPIWLIITAPLSYLGHNILLPTFFLFKILMAIFYAGSCYLVYKISERILPEHKLFNLVLFALNPLVIIELLVSAHNDGAMLFFALLGTFLFFAQKRILAIIAIIFSSQIKIPTISLIVPVLLSFIPVRQLKLDTQKYVWLFILFSSATFIYVVWRLEIQPWYFLWILPFAALLKPNRYVISLTTGLSLGLLLRYVPFLYSGDWGGLAATVENTFTLFVPAFFVIFTFIMTKTKLWKK